MAESKTTLSRRDKRAVAAFIKTMQKKTIPEIIEAGRRRQRDAAQYVKDNPWM